MSTEFKAGDKVVCVESRNPSVTVGKQYDVKIGSRGRLIFENDNGSPYFVESKSVDKGFEFKKVEEIEDINIGDLVYIIDTVNEVRIGVCIRTGVTIGILESRTGNDYCGFGFKATPDKRQGLVALYGEFAVPKLPPSPNEIMIELLKGGPHQAYASSDGHSRHTYRTTTVILRFIKEYKDGFFIDMSGNRWSHVIPVDSRGNEITELQE